MNKKSLWEWAVTIFYNLILICIFLLMIEFVLGYLLRHPEKIPQKFIAIFREYYMLHDRTVVQAIPDFARYDKNLCYTLKPGTFTFKNREFSNVFHVQSLGFRDDESSADYPGIIACGDSYTMGWGVAQNESFPEIIEKSKNIKVLNAGISSYGTVREILSLKKIKTDSLKFLIIQYSDNDYQENRDFIDHKNQLKVSTEKQYTEMCRKHLRHQRYYLFKHVILFPKIIAKWIIGKPVGVFDAKNETENLSEQNAFLRILDIADFLPVNTKIIVFNLDYRKSKSDFIPLLRKELNHFPDIKEKIILIDFSQLLTEKYFYLLDDHLTAKGHRLMANRIIQEIEKFN